MNYSKSFPKAYVSKIFRTDSEDHIKACQRRHNFPMEFDNKDIVNGNVCLIMTLYV